MAHIAETQYYPLLPGLFVKNIWWNSKFGKGVGARSGNRRRVQWATLIYIILSNKSIAKIKIDCNQERSHQEHGQGLILSFGESFQNENCSIFDAD